MDILPGPTMAWQSSINTQRESPTTHSQSIFLSSQGFQNLAFCDKGRNDTSKRTSYSQDWTKAACSDPVFVQTQLDIGHAMYLQPALKYAAIVNVTTNLGKAIFYGKSRVDHISTNAVDKLITKKIISPNNSHQIP